MTIFRARPLYAAALLSLALLAGSAAAAQAATVSLFAAPAATGAADCTSPANACTIDAAVTGANAASVTDSVRIRLAGGTYDLPAPSPTALAVTFAGPSLTFEAESGHPILDGKATVRLLSVGATSNVTIDGLEIRLGLTAGLGGAIQNGGTLAVKNSTFTGNVAANGGAITNSAGATLTVDSSTFLQNKATSVGGGAIISFGALTISRSALVENTGPVNGGAINVQPGGEVTVSSSTITGNTSGGLGGAMSNLGTLTVQASTITGNTATSGSVIATGNAEVTFAADIIGAQASGDACNPANTAILDGGYNLDVDGTCISATDPATGSRNGTTPYGASTYGAVLTAYLAGGLADNGGPTQTLALLNTPNPLTTLANPALAVVPPSFRLPATISGLPAPCSVSDQRGVVPVAGANCDIGAYLLQTTTTALTTPTGTVTQNASVTYTATITPAADGGTVAFDDGGASNPATTKCAAQSVSNGVATCTVSYPTPGDYPVTATYSGDGAKNNFVGSVSKTNAVVVRAAAAPTTPTAPAATDTTPPATKIRPITSVKQPITLRGTATDAGTIRRVRVSVARNVGKLCRFLQANRTYSKPRDCTKTSYIDANGTSSWSLKLPGLAAGRYTIWSRGIDAAGNVERKDRARNLRVFRIPQA